jgi:hypothetical protein
LRQVIPTIAIPLNGTASVALDLQPLLHRVYDRARFELAIDYESAQNFGLWAFEQMTNFLFMKFKLTVSFIFCISEMAG